MSVSRELEPYACIKCGAPSDRHTLAESSYRCAGCSLELAHLDVAPNGTVRAVLGWLRARQEVLQGRYQITGVLGRGGFAVTYLVEDLRLKGKRRALKEMPLIVYDEYETGLLSRLQHPAIPDIVDRFELDGMMYLVLEFGGQRTLEDERRRQSGRIAVPDVLRWMRQLCDVLSYLHELDPPVVHRDLKPENILLDERDRIMLIDFGIAKASGDFAVTRTVARSSSHGFSPPEQVLGAGTDERSDVYSLGATMYALLTGKAPPPAHERVAGSELAPPRSLAPSIPAALEAAIVQALSLNVHHRQQSIRELGRICEPGALDAAPAPEHGRLTVPTQRLAATAARAHAPDPAREPPPSAPAPAARVPTRRSQRIAYVVAPLLVVGVAAAWLFSRERPAEQQAVATAPAAPAASASDTTAPDAGASAAARGRASSGAPGAATRALEESLRARGTDVATPPPSAVPRPAPTEPAVPAPEAQAKAAKASGPSTPRAASTTGRAWLGLQLAAPASGETGALVQSVAPGSPAEQAGFLQADVILNIDGETVTQAADVVRLVGDRQPGARVSIGFVRAGDQQSLSVRLGTIPDAAPEFARAMEQYRNGDVDGAIATYTKLIAMYPSNASAYFNRGRAYLDKGNYDATIADMNKALKLGNVVPADVYCMRGTAYAGKGDFAKAIADETQAIKLNPKHALAYNNRANDKLRIRDFNGALADCNKSIALDPNSPLGYYNRGYAYLNTGNPSAAIGDWNRAMQIWPAYRTELEPLIAQITQQGVR